MAKKDKGKKIQMNIPEGFVRLKARSLPMHDCWLSDEWEDTGSAYIVVSRRHWDGHITAGVFFVDLLCLGVKQAQILYDLSPREYTDFLNLVREKIGIESADYRLVHDIIYSGLTFAKRYGFQAHEDFEVARYILEEDAVGQREYEIECGTGGKPMFLQTELESDAHAEQIVAQLEETAGRDNFYHKDNMPELSELEKMMAEMLDLDDEPEKFKVDEKIIEDSETFQFKIQLKGVMKPPVWRRVRVPSYFTFAQFHNIIGFAFGWSGSHLYSFSPRGYGSSPEITSSNDWDVFSDAKSDDNLDAAKTVLSDFFKKTGDQMIYIYDFGDDWTHRVSLEKIIPKVVRKASCLAGKGTCPPEDCGGAWRYEELKGILADKNHPEYAEMAEWLGLDDNEQWDANDFDLEDTQDFMTNIFPVDQE